MKTPLALTALAFLLSSCAAGPGGYGAPDEREGPPRLLEPERGPRIYRRLVCPQCKEAE